MNLVCFAGLTAGALVCNLLNNKFYTITPTHTVSFEHNKFKSNLENNYDVYTTYDEDFWIKNTNRIDERDVYFGTHCHPSVIKVLDKFKKVLVITITTDQSKFYRYLRSYYMRNNVGDTYKSNIMSAKNIIKNNFMPLDNCYNVEFEDIVNGNFVKDNNLNIDYFNEWKRINNYLYEPYNPVIVEYFEQAKIGD